MGWQHNPINQGGDFYSNTMTQFRTVTLSTKYDAKVTQKPF